MTKLRPLLLLVASVVVPLRSEAATTWVWPSFNCFDTLQACIDFASPGDIVEVASQGPILENLEIVGKSLTVRPHPGFFPVLDPGFVNVRSGTPNVNVTVTIQGLTLKNGYLAFTQTNPGIFDVRVLDNTFLNVHGLAIHIGAGSVNVPLGPVAFSISGNRIAQNDPSGSQYGAISVGGFKNSARGRIVGNVIQQTGAPTQSAVITLHNHNNPLTVDVLSNEIRGGAFNSGISLYQYGSRGRLAARVVNNLVVGQVDRAGSPAGISLSSTEGLLSAEVINNTIVGGDTGIVAAASLQFGARLTGILANNLVAGHRQAGIVIDPAIEATFLNENNLSFRNLTDSFAPGTGTIFDDPLFQAANDFRLRSNSPARDAGANARVPPDVTLDLAGSPRIQGAAVAIGAYER